MANSKQTRSTAGKGSKIKGKTAASKRTGSTPDYYGTPF